MSGDLTNEIAEEIRNKLLGNTDEYKVLRRQERPRKYFVTGVIYPRARAEQSHTYREYQSKVTPNSYSIEFATRALKFKFKVTPSFWVWFEGKKEPSLEPCYRALADSFDEETLWTPWSNRSQKQADLLLQLADRIRVAQDKEEEDEEQPELPLEGEEVFDEEEVYVASQQMVHIRKRFADEYLYEVDATGHSENDPKKLQERELSLPQFRTTWKDLGPSRWSGVIKAKAWRDKGDLTHVVVTIENTYGTLDRERRKICRTCHQSTVHTLSEDHAGRAIYVCRRCGKFSAAKKVLRGEPCWFDARAKLSLSEKIEDIHCEHLDSSVRAITTNCILDYSRTESAPMDVIFVEQMGKVITPRLVPVLSLPFNDFMRDPIAASRVVLEELRRTGGGSQTTVERLENAISRIEQDPEAVAALSAVARIFDRAFRLSGKPPNWRLFQVVTVLVGCGRWLDERRDISPIVLNVPTAGGKTEAFVALMLFASIYERLKGRRAVSIVKYPYRMLSTDQRKRLAGYMVFAEEVARSLGLEPLILGYFAGRSTREDSLPPETIIPRCPVEGCDADWRGEPARILGRPNTAHFVCRNGHRLYMAVGDTVFSAVPSIVIATPDKFVAKCSQREMGSILGSLAYRCLTHGFTANPICDQCRSDISSNRASVKVAFWTLDESHMIREDMGSLDSHYEKGHLDIASYNMGNRPIPILSTATLAGIRTFTENLGLGDRPIIIPEEEEKLSFFERATGENSVQHVVLGIEPRDRAVVFALGRVVAKWAEVLESRGMHLGIDDPDQNHPLYPLSQMMLYFPSHDKLQQTQEAVVNNVNRERYERGLQELRRLEVTGRLRDEEIELARDDINRRARDLVFATAMASIGIDIRSLNAISFYGMPTNVSEFVQVISRTARERPGIVFLVLDPGKERDRTYYDYMDLFLRQAKSALIEEVPINRYARNAIRYTFSSMAVSLLLFYYGPRNGRDYRFTQYVLEDIANGTLDENDIVERLKEMYAAMDDESGQYTKIIEGCAGIRGLWQEFKDNMRQYGVVKIWDYYYRDNIDYPMPRSLRSITERNVLIVPDQAVIRATSLGVRAVRTTTGDDSPEDEAEEMP